MLILKNISKQYEGSKTFTLNNINLEFGDSGLISILGPSGCGKTTLLNLIGGLDTPTEGEIIVDNYNLNKLSSKQLNQYHNQIVSFIYQSYNLINYLNVLENIELINKSEYTSELLEYLRLSNKRKCKINKLSGGEKQRVAIARSLVSNPSILLCDEPTGALDIKTSHEIMALLRELSRSMLVIVVTHNKTLAKKYSDRIITLEDGKIVKDTESIAQESKIPKTLKNVRISPFKILKIIANNLKNKYKRNILTLLAFSIGLISLSLVLAISTGFNKSLENEEKESLSRYPIFISETSTNLDNDLKDIFSSTDKKDDNYIYKNTDNHKNIIDKEYIKNLDTIDTFLEYKINTYLVDNKVLTISQKRIQELNIVKGEDIRAPHELLLVTNNNYVESSTLESIGLNKEKYSYEEILNYEFKIKKEKYKIVGIANFNEDSYFTDINGLLSYEEYPENQIPLLISLYPKDYNCKLNILKHLDKYENIEYTDYSSTIKSLSKTVMDAITIILICFSSISLLVSTITIGIISYISVIERIKEIGLFKSLGLSSFHIKSIFMGENIIISLMSCILSYSFAKLISLPINNFLFNLTGMKNILLINHNLLTILFLISIILSIMGSYFPIRKTKKLKIVDCLRYE